MAEIKIVKPGLGGTKAALEQYDVEKIQTHADGVLFFQGKNSGPSFYLSPDLVEQIIRVKQGKT
jgi:hypothetical protein